MNFWTGCCSQWIINGQSTVLYSRTSTSPLHPFSPINHYCGTQHIEGTQEHSSSFHLSTRSLVASQSRSFWRTHLYRITQDGFRPNSNAHLANDKELRSILITKIPLQNATPEKRNQSHFLGPVEKKPIGFLDLPFEIRNMIYKLCFVGVFGIVPCFTYQKSRTLHDRPYRSFK